MSEVKVNKISPRTNCGTVQLGDSGDTFTIPAGASITNSDTASGFGATGSASWNTTVKTSTFTAVAGEGYFVNTTGGAVTVNLPAGTAGAVVAIKDYARTFDTNAVTVAPNGSDKIGGDNTTDATLDVEGIAVTLVFVDSTQGWLVTDSGLQDEAPTAQFIEATGGTIATCGNFKTHTFTGPGTFQVTCAGNAGGSNTVDYLVVAGGGGAGGANGAGGGGGGFRLSNSTCMPAPTTSPLATPTAITVTATSFPITVGGGGTGTTNPTNQAPNGSNSIFSTITSTGGGGGAKNGRSGSPGGSGGGGGGESTRPEGVKGDGNTPPVSPPQGQPGGDGGIQGPCRSSAGGGGAGAAGASAPGPTSGGDGSFVSPLIAGCNGTPGPVGSTRYFSGGGGGGFEAFSGNNGAGGAGGGGRAGPGPGSPNKGNGTPATVNTGGGAGGASRGDPGSNDCEVGGNGGSGIVIIRYKFQ